EVVVGTGRMQRADGDRLLADVQVQEAADLGLRVRLGGVLLEAADEQHLAVHGQQRLAVEPLQGGALALPCRRGRAAPRAPGPAPCRRGAGARLGHRLAWYRPGPPGAAAPGARGG